MVKGESCNVETDSEVDTLVFDFWYQIAALKRSRVSGQAFDSLVAKLPTVDAQFPHAQCEVREEFKFLLETGVSHVNCAATEVLYGSVDSKLYSSKPL